jgi:hypothetical protein
MSRQFHRNNETLILVLTCVTACCLLVPFPSLAQDAQAQTTQSDEDAIDTAVERDRLPDADPGAPAGNVGSSATTNNSNSSNNNNSYIFPTRAQMGRYWVGTLVGPGALLRMTFRSSWSTWVTNSPEEWGEGFSGWSKRFGVAAMSNSINQTSNVLLSLATHQDPKYYHCGCTRFWPKVRHGAKLAWTSRNQSGEPVFSPAKVVSPFTGPLVTRNTVYPDRYDSMNALGAGALNLLGNMGWNIVRELFYKK